MLALLAFCWAKLYRCVCKTKYPPGLCLLDVSVSIHILWGQNIHHPHSQFMFIGCLHMHPHISRKEWSPPTEPIMDGRHKYSWSGVRCPEDIVYDTAITTPVSCSHWHDASFLELLPLIAICRCYTCPWHGCQRLAFGGVTEMSVAMPCWMQVKYSEKKTMQHKLG